MIVKLSQHNWHTVLHVLSCNQHDPHHSVCTWRLFLGESAVNTSSRVAAKVWIAKVKDKDKDVHVDKPIQILNHVTTTQAGRRSEWCVGSLKKTIDTETHLNTLHGSYHGCFKEFLSLPTLYLIANYIEVKNKTWQVQLFKPFTQKR